MIYTLYLAIRSDTKTLQPDGRPSLNTMTAQWEFMRDQFMGSNDENLVRAAEKRREEERKGVEGTRNI